MHLLYILSISLAALVNVHCSESPKDILLKIWKPCRRSDPKLNECLRESIELMRTKLANGIPELIIPPCDPLLIPEVNIKQNAGAIWVDSEYTDVIISGLSNFTLRDLHVEPAQHAFRIDLWFPMLSMKANYHMHGKVLLMPLSGNGTCTGNFTDVDATVTMKTDVDEMTKSNGMAKHLNVSDVKVTFNIGGASVKLDNLFNGDLELGELMNKFLNENWREITAEVRPALAESIENLLSSIASRLFEMYSIEQILPH